MRSSSIAGLSLVVLASLTACSSKDQGPQAEVFTATLTGAAENPPKTTSATGNAKVTVNSDRTLTVDLTVSGLTPTAQHIHGPAADATVNAPVIVPLTIAVGQTLTATGSFTGTVSYDSLLVLLRAGKAYVNVHTAANPGGEIRGTLVRQ